MTYINVVFIDNIKKRKGKAKMRLLIVEKDIFNINLLLFVKFMNKINYWGKWKVYNICSPEVNCTVFVESVFSRGLHTKNRIKNKFYSIYSILFKQA
jgi:hypothetical protein